MNKSLYAPFLGLIAKRRKSEEDETLSLLSQIEAFADIPDNSLKKIAELLHERRFKKGEIVFREGEPGVGLYIVKTGEVAIYVHDEEKTLKEINETEHVSDATRGEMFGDIALFSDMPRAATVIATENSELLGFFKPDLLELIRRNPNIGSQVLLRLLDVAGNRLNQANHKILELQSKIDTIQKKPKVRAVKASTRSKGA